MALAEVERAKRFKLYRNGDRRYLGKEFVLNRRRIRTWDAFLQAVTADVKASEAIRSIRTPNGGTKVGNLDDLEDSSTYVAVGAGTFKKAGYLTIEESLAKLQKSPRAHQGPGVRPLEHRRLQVSGRIRKVPVDVISIFVYANGKELEPARRVTLTRSMLRSWEAILGQITEKVNLTSGAARRLYTVEGHLVADPGLLKTSDHYVAVGADVGGFKRLEYGVQKPAFNSSPKQPRRRLEPLPHPPVRRGRKLRTGTDTTIESSMTSTGSSEKSQRSERSNQARPTERARAAPRKKEADVFHARPIKHKRSSEKKPVDYDRDEGGIFKAKDKQRETLGAREVEDTGDTQVDLPIDQVEAEEVKDEDIAHETETNGDGRAVTPARENHRSPTPTHRSSTPAHRSPTPAQRSPTPAQQTNRSPTPAQRSPTPANRSPNPAQRSPTPAQRSPTPAQRSPTPAQRSPSPAQEAKQSPAPSRQSSRAATPREENGRSSSKADAEETKADEKAKEVAASRIQAGLRGYNTRRDLKNQRQEKQKDPQEAS